MAHALPVSSKTTSEVDVTSSSSFSLIKANPFGLTTDPQEIKNTTYTSATTIINQTIYSIASKIFSYETVGDENLLRFKHPTLVTISKIECLWDCSIL